MNVTHGLRRALQINPHGLATVFKDRRRNSAESGDRVARFASGLQTLGIGADIPLPAEGRSDRAVFETVEAWSRDPRLAELFDGGREGTP